VRGRFVLADPDICDGVGGRFAHLTEGSNKGLDWPGGVTDKLELVVFIAGDGDGDGETCGNTGTVRGKVCAIESVELSVVWSVLANSYNDVRDYGCSEQRHNTHLSSTAF